MTTHDNGDQSGAIAGPRHGREGWLRTTAPANDENLDDDVLTVEGVAELLKLGRNAVYDAVNRRELPHRRIGKQIRFSRRGLMRWLASWSLQGAKEGK